LDDILDVAFDDGLAVLTLQREAKLNALSHDLEAALRAAIHSREVAQARCVIITGGEKVFSSGADVTEMNDPEPASILEAYRSTGALFEEFARLPQPTLAAISGYCLGGGLELALAADFRLADATAVFGFPEVEIGIVPSSGGTLRAVRAIGAPRALELILLHDRIDAPEAFRIGLVSEIVPAGSLRVRMREIGKTLAARPALAAAVAKRLVGAVEESSREVGILLEQIGYAMLAPTSDARNAVERFTATRAQARHRATDSNA
jgi:enoyl-CoA hydratase/carnithine racemase